MDNSVEVVAVTERESGKMLRPLSESSVCRIRQRLLSRPTVGVRARTIQRAYATAVSYQVGHGRAAMLCFKCFWTFLTCCKLMFQVFQLF
jgi:hypothetical protein